MVADGAVHATRRLLAPFANDRSIIEQSGRRAGSALRVYAALRERPILSITSAAERAGLSFSGASAGMKMLVDLGVARETTGRRRGRLFVYDRYLAILNEGTEVAES